MNRADRPAWREPAREQHVAGAVMSGQSASSGLTIILRASGNQSLAARKGISSGVTFRSMHAPHSAGPANPSRNRFAGPA